MALHGRNIPIDGKASDPATLNAWLQNNAGYDTQNDLEEDVIPNIAPSEIVWVGKVIPGNKLSPEQVKQELVNGTIVIANVMDGGHFVLVVGFDDGESNFYVHDPGFSRDFYVYEGIVGWRIFQMK